jgi:dolichol-phosphate mannosyltransferase
MNPSISLVILCLNEELTLKPTYNHYKSQLLKLSIDHEIIIVNDGSTDQTEQVAEGLRDGDKNIILLSNDQRKGMGYGYKKGLKIASKEYYMFAGGGSAPSEEDIKQLINSVQKNDLVLAYVKNPQIRRPVRQILSKCFTFLMSAITGLKLKYFNAMVIARVSHLKRVNVRSDGHTFSAEFAIKLIKHHNCTYCEVPVTIGSVKTKPKNSFNLAFNLIQSAKFIMILFYDIHLAKPENNS